MRCFRLVAFTALMVCSCGRRDVRTPEDHENTSRPAEPTSSAPTPPSATSSAAASPSTSANVPDANNIDGTGPSDVPTVEADEPESKGGVSGERHRRVLDIHYEAQPSDLSKETSSAIRRLTVQKRHRFARCMEAHPFDSSQPSGTFVVRLFIRPEGSVPKTAVDFARFPNKEGRDCIVSVAKEFERETLPMQQSVVVVNVSYSDSAR